MLASIFHEKAGELLQSGWKTLLEQLSIIYFQKVESNKLLSATSAPDTEAFSILLII